MSKLLPNEDVALYVKKPIPVGAVQITQEMVEAYLFDKKPLPKGVRCESSSIYPAKRLIIDCRLYCSTVENDLLEVRVGNWIVGPGARGEFWPVQDDIFRATYEPLTALKETP